MPSAKSPIDQNVTGNIVHQHPSSISVSFQVIFVLLLDKWAYYQANFDWSDEPCVPSIDAMLCFVISNSHFTSQDFKKRFWSFKFTIHLNANQWSTYSQFAADTSSGPGIRFTAFLMWRMISMVHSGHGKFRSSSGMQY